MIRKNKNSFLTSASNPPRNLSLRSFGFLSLSLFTLLLISGCPEKITETITIMGPTVTNTISNTSGDLVVSNNTCSGSIEEAAISINCEMDIALTAQPISEVGVILASSYAPVLVSNSLIFNSNNWSNFQRAYLIIQHDGNGSNRLSVPVEISAAAPGYLAVTNKEVASFTYEHAYCGDLRGNIPVIDGTPNSFFLSGDGSSNAPYVIPLMRGCGGFAFTYDPNYQNGAPDIHLRVTGNASHYLITVSNTEANQPEESMWQFVNTSVQDVIRFTTDPAGNFQTLALFSTDNFLLGTHEDYVISTVAPSTKWLSQKSLFWTLTLNPKGGLPYISFPY